ncbi:MAG: Fur family transcriptional regulator [Burkholderiales bacterium]
MNAFLQQFKGGDRRSIGAVPEVVNQVMAYPGLFPVVFNGMTDPDPLARMRCSDAIEKITACRPEYLGAYKKRLIKLAGAAQQQEVHGRAAARLPEISRATVYKTLGEIREVVVGGRSKRYDPNLDAAHEHLVCERCGLIRDVYPEGKKGLRLAKAGRYGFTLSGIEIVFRGLCPDCAKGKAGR